MYLRFLVFFILLIAKAEATSLVNRYQFSSTGLLPTGVWTFGLSHGQSVGPNGSFNSKGSRVSNESFFSKDVTYSNLLDEIKTPIERDLARAAFDVYGRAQDENAGRVINDVSVDQKSNAYFIGRGLSKKSNLFVIFPIVTIQTKFRSKFVHSKSLLKLTDELKAEGQYIEANEILKKSQNALREGLNDNGYAPYYPRELTTLANIHVNHRYSFLQDSSVEISADSTFIIPAGKKFDEDDFLNYKIREENFSFKQNLTGQFKLHHSLSLLPAVYYQKRFASKQSRRIPLNSASPLSSDVDSKTNVQYGDSLGTSLQINYIPKENYLLYVGQSYEKKFQDKYSGNKFEQNRYDYLAQDTEQDLGIGYLGITVNTIDLFLKQKFLIPMDVNVQYSFTNMGSNTFNTQAIAMNLMVFYK